MGLSEPRRKQRLVGAAAHRNAAWTNDMSLPGQRMMSMMGWAPGEGLGTTNKGLSTNLTVSMKLDNKGIGAHRHEREAREQGRSDAWVGAGGDLGSLFDRLNQANEQATPSPPPEPRPSSSRLAHRAKFRRAKQLHGQSAANLNEIFGISASAQASTESQPGKDKQDDKEKEDKAKRKEERRSGKKTRHSGKKTRRSGKKTRLSEKKTRPEAKTHPPRSASATRKTSHHPWSYERMSSTCFSTCRTNFYAKKPRSRDASASRASGGVVPPSLLARGFARFLRRLGRRLSACLFRGLLHNRLENVVSRAHTHDRSDQQSTETSRPHQGRLTRRAKCPLDV